ncbi:hypothetical protein [Streptomyces sp. NPDC047999]|uniref:hypothetical protein n=1 Tax=Streptomyces sp. NPDC047999 TaxID=3365497 RepID=UPI0037191808
MNPLATARVRLCAAAAVLPLLLLTGAAPAGARPAAAPTAPQVVVGPSSADGQASKATCPSGTRVAGGGHFSNTFHYANGGDIYDAVRANAPTRAGDGWTVQQLKGKAQAVALCVPADEAPSVAVSDPSADGQAVKATCPSGTRVAGGGFFSNVFHYANGGTIYDYVRSSSPSRAGDGWLAQQVKGKVQAVALCAPEDRAPSVVVSDPSGDAQAARATCPSGRRVVGGGFFSNVFHYANGGTMYDAVLANSPSRAGDAWVAQQMKGKVQAVALCVPADEAPGVVVSDPSGDAQAVKATCPSGSRVVGGGHFSNTFHRANGGNIYDYVRTSSPSGSGDGWVAQQVKGKVQAIALCGAS